MSLFPQGRQPLSLSAHPVFHAMPDSPIQKSANRKRGPGITENVRSRRINLEGNTHAQEINVSQLPV
jgi:hypothetical protein